MELLPRFERAIARYPFAPPLLYSIGITCLQYGYDELWLNCVRDGLALPHLTPQDHLFRGEAKIRLGDWSGWVDREARLFNPDESSFVSPEARRVQWTTKRWDGDEPIDDRSILVMADGGFGDCLQMVRYLPELARVAGAVALAVRPECHAFAAHNFGHVANVVRLDRAVSTAYDRYAWLMSLPALLGPIPTFHPLRAPTQTDDGPRVTADVRIGLCWAGNSNHPTDEFDRGRSISLDDLAPVTQRSGTCCYTLQVGTWAGDADRYPGIARPPIPLHTFADTASVIARLDCVVTIDTAVAHLAGNLGVPTYLLLPCAPDFRWEMLATTTRWYPSVHLIRQHTRGEWTQVVAQLMIELDTFAHSSRIATSSLTALAQSPKAR
jgi:hypothetical protein